MTRFSKRVSKPHLIFLRLQHSVRSETYAGLCWIADDRGYSNAWVGHKFKAIFGEWPSYFIAPIDPATPSTDLVSWVANEQRKYGMKMQRQAATVAAVNSVAASRALDRIEAIMAELEANPLARDFEFREEGDTEVLELACDIERQMARNICTCDWSPVNTTTIDPPHIVRPDPNCAIHRAETH